MSRVVSFLLAVLFLAAAAGAQTIKPLINDPTVNVSVPKGWVETSPLALRAGFRTRGDASLQTAFHPEGSRPTDLPYALVEQYLTSPKRDTLAEVAERAAVYFRTAVDPPSKADRAGTWKTAVVTTPVLDQRRNTFSFRATIQYEGGISGNATYHVTVYGHFGEFSTITVSTWADSAARGAHTEALNSLATSALLPVASTSKPGLSFQQKLVRIAKVSGAILILFVVGLQIFVLIRERRQRQAEDAAWNGPLV